MSIFEEVERFLTEHEAPLRLRELFSAEKERYEKLEQEQSAPSRPKVIAGPGSWLRARRGY